MSTPRVGSSSRTIGASAISAAGDQRLLLVAAAERQDAGREALGRRAAAARPRCSGGRALGAGVDEASGGAARDAADADVVAHAPEREDALLLAVAGDEAGAAGAVASPAGGRGPKSAVQQRLLAARLRARRGRRSRRHGARPVGRAARSARRRGDAGRRRRRRRRRRRTARAAAPPDRLDQARRAWCRRGAGPRPRRRCAWRRSRSAMSRTSCSLWLMKMTARPRPPARGRRRAARGPAESSEEVGSSRMSSLRPGRAAARAISTICRSAMSRGPTRASGSMRVPGKTAARLSRTAGAVGAAPERAGARVVRGFEEEVLGRREVRAEREFLVDDADAAALRLARAVGGGVGRSRRRAGRCRRRARWCRSGCASASTCRRRWRRSGR